MPLTTELLGPSPDPAKLGAGEHNDGGGLYLIVRLLGSASWIFKFTLGGKAYKMGLGSFDERNEVEARQLAHQYRRLVRDGKDPRNERVTVGIVNSDTTNVTPTFHGFAHHIFGKRVFKNRKSLACWKRTIDVHFKALHTTQVHEIEISDVVEVLEPLYRDIPSVGREARQRLEYILNGAIALYPKAMGRNNASRGLLASLLPKLPKKGQIRGDHVSLHYSLMPQFWCELCAINSIASKALQLLILTCVRTGELLQMTFKQVVSADEFEKGAFRWKIPGKMMKAAKHGEKGIDGDIPLTPRMLQVIEEMRALLADQPKEMLVFPSQQQPGKYGVELGDRTLLALLQETLKYNGKDDKRHATVHGFRGTFKTWADEETEHQDQTTEFCLHHVVGNAAKAAYKKGAMWKKRKQALLDWEAYVTSQERRRAAEAQLPVVS
jgi:integrase